MQIVPQYIDVEDKIAGPLTWKHIGWLFAGAGILLVAWTFLDQITFFIAAAIIIPATAALAFAKPNGVTMVEYIGYGFNYFFRPKIYTWQREVAPQKIQKKKKENITVSASSQEKQLTSDDVVAIAQTLDSHGVERNERLQQLIKERAKK